MYIYLIPDTYKKNKKILKTLPKTAKQIPYLQYIS